MIKVYLTQKEMEIISLTPPNECWICDNLFENIRRDKKGIYILEKFLLDNGFSEHLKQLLKRPLSVR